MEDIAELAEVGKGTLYRYFKDKEELYMALLSRVAEEWTERMCVAAEVPGCRAKLEAVVAAIIDFCDENPHVIDLIQHAEVMQGPDAELPSQRMRRENFRLVESIFEEARRSGEFHVAESGAGGAAAAGRSAADPPLRRQAAAAGPRSEDRGYASGRGRAAGLWLRHPFWRAAGVSRPVWHAVGDRILNQPAYAGRSPNPQSFSRRRTIS